MPWFGSSEMSLVVLSLLAPASAVAVAPSTRPAHFMAIVLRGEDFVL